MDNNAVLQKFRQSMNGQQIVLPNLYSLFPGWTPRLHPEYRRCREESLEPWLDRWVLNPKICAKLKMADFGLFAAIMCAEASYEKLCTVAKHFAWYFIWDDLFDCGSLTGDLVKIRIYRAHSIQYIRYVLCGHGKLPDLSEHTTEHRNALLCFGEVGRHVREACSQDVQEFLLDKMLNYMNSVENVNSVYNADQMPPVQEYWERRELTAGAYPVIATIPFIYGIEFSLKDVDSQMAQLWKHTSYIVHITNDMLSFRKELKVQQIESLLPILTFNYGISCTEAMEESMRFVQEHAVSFAEIEKNYLVSRQSGTGRIEDERSRIGWATFMQGCTDVAMGLIHWSYMGQRYFKREDLEEGNIMRFTVEL